MGIESARFLVNNLSGHGTYDANLGELIPDEDQITSNYLIKTINSSLIQCRHLISNGTIQKCDFFEYVLPHRLGKEALSDWKDECVTEYYWLNTPSFKGGAANSTALAKIQAINSQLIDHFTYSDDISDAQNLTWKQLISLKSGNCVAMTHTITYPLRALGVPVAIDFTPTWGNANGDGHSWNAFVSSPNYSAPFLGFEASPPLFSPFRIHKTLNRLPAKVFRETYSENVKSLPNIVPNIVDVPPSLNFKSAVDVTNEYVSTDDIKIKLSSGLAESFDKKMLYLSCFNVGKWKPVFWSEYMEDTYHFKKMATKMLYLPTTFSKTTVNTAIDYPFAVENGVVQKFRPDLANLQNISIELTQPKEMDALALFGLDITKSEFYRQMSAVMKNQRRSTPKLGVEYELYYWDGEWRLIGSEKVTKNGKLIFVNVPKNAVYRLISDKNSEKTARIFSYHGRQQWW